MYEHLVSSETLVHVSSCLDTDILHQATGDTTKVLSHRSSTCKRESHVSADFAQLFIDMDYLLHSLEIEIVFFLAEPLFGILAGVGRILMVNIQVGSKIPILGIVEPSVCSATEVLFSRGRRNGCLCREETYSDQDFFEHIRMIHHRFHYNSGVTGEQGKTAHQAATVVN